MSDSDDYEPSVPSDEDGPDDAAADWDSDADEGVVAQCLFCPLRSPAAAVVGHMAEAHHFTCKDVVRAARERGAPCDDYASVRVVNFVRSRVAAGVAADVATEEVISGAGGVWTDEAFLRPFLADDALLFSMDLDDEDDEDDGARAIAGVVAEDCEVKAVDLGSC